MIQMKKVNSSHLERKYFNNYKIIYIPFLNIIYNYESLFKENNKTELSEINVMYGISHNFSDRKIRNAVKNKLKSCLKLIHCSTLNYKKIFK